MKIVIISNFMQHYMFGLFTELNRLTGGKTWFVETKKIPKAIAESNGFCRIEHKNIVRSWQSEAEKLRGFRLSDDADVMIAGGGRFILYYERRRLRQGKLAFDYAERALKKGWINAFSPTNILTQLNYHLFFRNKPIYKLCAGAFVSNDMYAQKAFIGKCFKFGYFPQIEDIDIKRILEQKNPGNRCRILWCARFISWKHPEMAVHLGEKLRDDGYDFEINMIGIGDLLNKTRDMIDVRGLSEKISLLGAMSNNEVKQHMREHDIFIFTSDRNEGWGVVLSEAMSQLCCPVAANLIGSVPWLIKHRQNGLQFKTGNIDSLFENVKYLIDHPEERKEMTVRAYMTMRNEWSPKVAAERLIAVSECLLAGEPFSYNEGPMSESFPFR